MSPTGEKGKIHKRVCRWSNFGARATEHAVPTWAREHDLGGRLRVRCVRDHGRGPDGVITMDGLVIANLEFEQFGRRRGVRAIIRRHRLTKPPVTLVLALEAREVRRLIRYVAPGLLSRRRIRIFAVPDIVPPLGTRRTVMEIVARFLSQSLRNTT